MMRFLPILTLFILFQADAKAQVRHRQSSKGGPVSLTKNRLNQVIRPSSSSVLRRTNTVNTNRSTNVPRSVRPQSSQKVGVFFMPFWDVDNGSGKMVNWFWGCLQETWLSDCLFTKSSLWGPSGRNYSGETRPSFYDKKPARGFYNPNNSSVVAAQIAEMKDHNIDYIIYDWFWGRHWYHDLSMYYPAAWQSAPLVNSDYGLRTDARAGVDPALGLKRIRVPGMELHSDQLHTIVSVLDSLPPEKRIGLALNWCDDSYDGWINWLKTGQDGSGTLEKLPPWFVAQNMPTEKHSKDLFLKVHEKIVHLWVDKYFSKSYYLKDDQGRPIVYHMYLDNTQAWAAAYGITMKQLVDLANTVAKSRGLPGIKFIVVGGENSSVKPQKVLAGYGSKTKWTPNNNDLTKWWVGGVDGGFVSRIDHVKSLVSQGYEGLSAYIYYSFTKPDDEQINNTSFDLMIQNYQSNWQYWKSAFAGNSKFDYHLPTAMGWDSRPYGGYTYNSTGKPNFPQLDIGAMPKDKFKSLLTSAKNTPDTKYITVCCWNEYMEGNYIEPTVGTGFSYLEAISEVFASSITTTRGTRGTIQAPSNLPAGTIKPTGGRPSKCRYPH